MKLRVLNAFFFCRSIEATSKKITIFSNKKQNMRNDKYRVVQLIIEGKLE